MTPEIVLFLLTVHFVADFVCQPDWIAINKSKDWGALTLHVLIYSVTFLFALWNLMLFNQNVAGLSPVIWFVGVTFAAHWVTDAITSRITTALWFIEFWDRPADQFPLTVHAYPYAARIKPGYRHWFFVMIGFDQLLHAWQLILTWSWVTH